MSSASKYGAPQVPTLNLTPFPRYVHQHDEEYDAVKKTRRPGRPANVKEDLLKMKVEALQKEYQNGFCTLHIGPGQDTAC